MKLDTNKWKDIPCSLIGRVNIVRDIITTQISLQIQCNLYQNPNDTFCINRKFHPKIHMESQETPNSQNNLEKEQSWRSHISSFLNLLQSYSNQNSVIQTQRLIEQNKEAKINPHIYGQMIFEKCTKTIQGERRVFSTNGVGKTRYTHAK